MNAPTRTGSRTATALCPGAGCRRRETTGQGRRPSSVRQRLCPVCRDDLAADLAALPVLHAECGRLLGGSDQPRDKTSGGPLPGMPFNAAAAEARAAILGVLGSWSGLVAAERRITPPRRSPDTLAAFLHRHTHWLAAHPAAGEVSAEIARLARTARRVAHPSPLRKVPVGDCVEADCTGRLTAYVRPQSPEQPAEITCDADSGHRWLGHEWTRLRRRMSTGAQGAAPPGGAAQWLSAADIARLWRVAPGSVYRHASERGWRRRSSGGRTYYHEGDVRQTLSGRA